MMRTRLMSIALLTASTLGLTTACGSSNTHTNVNADKGVIYGSSSPSSSGSPSTDTKSDAPATHTSEPADTETKTEPPASSYIVVASCNSEGTVRRVDWLNGETGLTVKSKFFNVNSASYDSLSNCDGSTIIGAQERTVYNDTFSELVAAKIANDNKQYIGVIHGSKKPGKSTFSKLSGPQQYNTPGGFNHNGRVFYKDYSKANNAYRLCTVTVKGSNRSCDTLTGALADDHRVYLPANSRQAKIAGYPGLAVAPGGAYSFMWNGASLQFGASDNIGTSAAKTAYTTDGSMAPYPFQYVNKTHLLAYDSDGIYFVEIKNKSSRSTLKIRTLYKSNSFGVADPVLSPDFKTITFRAVDGSVSSLMTIPVTGTKRAAQVRNFDSEKEGSVTIMAWISNS